MPGAVILAVADLADDADGSGKGVGQGSLDAGKKRRDGHRAAGARRDNLVRDVPPDVGAIPRAAGLVRIEQRMLSFAHCEAL